MLALFKLYCKEKVFILIEAYFDYLLEKLSEENLTVELERFPIKCQLRKRNIYKNEEIFLFPSTQKICDILRGELQSLFDSFYIEFGKLETQNNEKIGDLKEYLKQLIQASEKYSLGVSMVENKVAQIEQKLELISSKLIINLRSRAMGLEGVQKSESEFPEKQETLKENISTEKNEDFQLKFVKSRNKENKTQNTESGKPAIANEALDGKGKYVQELVSFLEKIKLYQKKLMSTDDEIQVEGLISICCSEIKTKLMKSSVVEYNEMIKKIQLVIV